MLPWLPAPQATGGCPACVQGQRGPMSEQASEGVAEGTGEEVERWIK